jgi:hypothetical protein
MKNKEYRVYIIDIDNIGFDLSPTELQNEKWIELAERIGDVYTLQGFAEAYNNSFLPFDNSFIRFIEVDSNN